MLTALKNLQQMQKIASKRAIQKTAEATGDLTGNKIADKIRSTSTKCKESPSKELHLNEVNNEIPKERRQIINELRLI